MINIPDIGLGTLQLKGQECYEVVLEALSLGYRLIDTASMYDNEEEIGRAIKESGIDRKELFITTKLWISDYSSSTDAILESMKKLGVNYLDLVLIHQPFGDCYQGYRGLEKLYHKGLIHHIGVSNFSSVQIIDLYMNVEVKPTVNQIEIHPFYQRDEDIKVMKDYNILTQAWGPFNEGLCQIFEHPLLVQLANVYHTSVPSLLIQWHTQRDIYVIPKSTNSIHLKENIEKRDFIISDEDMNKIKELDKGYSEIIDHHSLFTVKCMNNLKREKL